MSVEIAEIVAIVETTVTVVTAAATGLRVGAPTRLFLGVTETSTPLERMIVATVIATMIDVIVIETGTGTGLTVTETEIETGIVPEPLMTRTPRTNAIGRKIGRWQTGTTGKVRRYCPAIGCLLML